MNGLGASYEWVGISCEFFVIFISVSCVLFLRVGACSVLVVLQLKLWLLVFPFISV